MPLQVACRGRNEVPDPESVNTFVFEVGMLCIAIYQLIWFSYRGVVWLSAFPEPQSLIVLTIYRFLDLTRRISRVVAGIGDAILLESAC